MVQVKGIVALAHCCLACLSNTIHPLKLRNSSNTTHCISSTESLKISLVNYPLTTHLKISLENFQPINSCKTQLSLSQSCEY